MFKQLLIVSMLVVIATFTSLNGAAKIKGNGNIIKDERQIGVFTTLNVENTFNVFIRQGNTHSVTIETDDNLIDDVDVKLSCKKLTVKYLKKIDEPSVLNIYVTVNKLSELNISDDSKVTFISMDAGKNFTIEMEDKAQIENADIKANNIKIKLSGESRMSGQINCSELVIDAKKSANVKLEGEASKKIITTDDDVEINVADVKSQSTKIKATGNSKVIISKGENAEIKTSGRGSVRSATY